MIYNKLFPFFFFRITFNFDDDYDTQSNRICYSTHYTHDSTQHQCLLYKKPLLLQYNENHKGMRIIEA